MADAIVRPNILKMLLTTGDSKPRPHSHHKITTERFPFFHLPTLIIERIVKQYLPVKDKVETLSEIPEFQHFLIWKSMWYPSTFCSYQEMRKIKPGWYLFLFDMRYLRYYEVNYDEMIVTVFHFYIHNKGCRIPFDTSFHELDRKFTSIYCNAIQKLYIRVNEVRIYEYNSCLLSSPIFLWIVPKENLIRWPQDTVHDTGCGVHILIDNRCHFFDKKLHSHHIKLTYEKNTKNVILECAYSRKETCRNWGTKLEPLQFPLCQGEGSSHYKPCTSCESGPNFDHT